MGMTLAQKIIARHSSSQDIRPGQFLGTCIDLVMCNDGTGPLAIRAFAELGVDRVFDPSRIVVVLDHFCPSRDITSAYSTTAPAATQRF